MNVWVPTLLIGATITLIMWGVFWVLWNYPDLKRNYRRRRRRCQNCHYLTKASPQLDLVSWDWEDREERFPRIKIPPGRLEHDDWGGYSGYDMTIGCHKEIWSQNHNEMKEQNDFYTRTSCLKKYAATEEILVFLCHTMMGSRWRTQVNCSCSGVKTGGTAEEFYGRS